MKENTDIQQWGLVDSYILIEEDVSVRFGLFIRKDIIIALQC